MLREPKAKVIIMRKWNNPEIKMYVDLEQINLSISLEDFKNALKQQIGSVTFVFRKKTFDELLDKAFEEVIRSIKAESSKLFAK